MKLAYTAVGAVLLLSIVSLPLDAWAFPDSPFPEAAFDGPYEPHEDEHDFEAYAEFFQVHHTAVMLKMLTEELYYWLYSVCDGDDHDCDDPGRVFRWNLYEVVQQLMSLSDKVIAANQCGDSGFCWDDAARDLVVIKVNELQDLSDSWASVQSDHRLRTVARNHPIVARMDLHLKLMKTHFPRDPVTGERWLGSREPS